MLHAALLGFRHPVTNVALEWTARRAARRISSRCTNRWEARSGDLSDGNRSASALGARSSRPSVRLRRRRPAAAGAARRRPRPGVPGTHGAAAGVPLVALLPGAAARHRERPRTKAPPCWSATTRAASPTTARCCCTASAATTRATAACARWSPTSLFVRAGWPTSSRASAACARRWRPRCRCWRAASWWPSSPKGSRASASCIANAIGWRASAAAASSGWRGEAQVPLLPVAIVGAEEIHPVIGKITRFAEAARHPVHPDHPDISMAWARSGCCRCRPNGRSRSARRSRRRRHGDEDGNAARRGERCARAIDGMIADLLAQRRSILFG